MRKYRKTYIVTDEIVNSLKQAREQWQVKSITEVLELLIKYGIPEVNRRYEEHLQYVEMLEKNLASRRRDVEKLEAEMEELKFS